MGDLATGGLILGAIVAALFLVGVWLVLLGWNENRREIREAEAEARRRQVTAREAELREIENGPAVRFDTVLDALPDDIRKEFDR